MMTEAAYDAERARLRELYGDSSAEAAAKRDQALAELFMRSEWTQEKLAEKEGKSQQWIVTRLRFGRFLNFTTTVVKSESLPKELTERRFRSFWEQTKGNERDRFDAVVKLMQDPEQPSRQDRKKQVATKTEMVRETLRPLIKAGKPIDREKWAEKLGVATGTVQAAVTQERARLEGLRGEPDEIMVSIHVLIEKLVPLFERVKEQSKRHVGLISVGELFMIAAEGRRLLDSWASGDTSVRRVRGHVVPFKRPAKAEKGAPDECSLQADR